MRFNQNNEVKEPEVSITYASMSHQIQQLTAFIHSLEINIKCKEAGKVYFVTAGEIYYLESVDKKCFIYCKEKVHQAESRLYELESELKAAGFVRISKSVILNIEVLKAIKSLPNSRLEATLHNGEKVFITRKYLSEIKDMLQRRSMR